MSYKIIRNRLCCTQVEYAKLLNMDRSHLAHVERGKRNLASNLSAIESLHLLILAEKDTKNPTDTSRSLSQQEIVQISRALESEFALHKYRSIQYNHRLISMKTRYPDYLSAIEDLQYLIDSKETYINLNAEWLQKQLESVKKKAQNAHPKKQLLMELTIATHQAARDKAKEMLMAWIAEHGNEGVESFRP